jgi:hypothetical protein
LSGTLAPGVLSNNSNQQPLHRGIVIKRALESAGMAENLEAGAIAPLHARGIGNPSCSEMMSY